MQSSNERATEPSQSTQSFMFSEEQISKQLIDMKEQTDFMKRFRCALGIALREIKTLRTTTENGNDIEDPVARNDAPSCQLPKDFHHSQEIVVENPEGNSSHNHQCVCGDFANSDYRILKKYLNEMEETAESRKKSDAFIGKPPNFMEKTKQDSTNLIERSIAHIERLKGTVESRNALIKRLCQQLSLARLIRVRRETKLEEKLQEIAKLKAENTKMRRSYEKQVIIARSLRAALNSQKQKIQSSGNVVKRLDETRKAFDSLKSQASHLMTSLHEKDNEIAELTSKLVEKENKPPENGNDCSNVDVNIEAKNLQSVAQTDHRNGTTTCANCERQSIELESMKNSYHRLYDDFEYYRRKHPHYLAPESAQSSRDYDQNHPYNRRRMHAPYASPESYRRVSRPPLRRRLNCGSQYSNESVGMRTNNFGNMGDTLLSPIDEFVENPEETGQEAATMDYSENVVTPVGNSHQYDTVQSRNEQTHFFVGDRDQLTQNDTTNKLHAGNSEPLHLNLGEETETVASQKYPSISGASTSYLELGSSASPSRDASSMFGIEAKQEPLRLNSFIRRKEEPDDFETGDLSPRDDVVNVPQSVQSPEPFHHSFGVIWHPVLKERTKKTPSSPEVAAREELRLEKLDISQKPARIQLFGSKSHAYPDSDHPEGERGKNRSHFVTYKGHEIDVTNFSIHEFRDIIWSLDGGQESANAFIKFLASTAKKLNASPKWAGKHTMGNPDDWLALRGLY